MHMNRFAKKFRVFAGICAILNLVAVFLPVTREIRENYADVTYHQFDYIQSALAKFLPFLESGKVQVTAGQAGLILLVMLLPMILAVAAFVWAIAGGHGQKGSSILIFLVFFGYIVMALSIGQFWPDEANGVSYARGIGSILPVIFSGAGAIFSVLALIATPGKVKIASEGIPEVEMFKQQKIDAQYNIIEQQEPEKPKEEQQDLPPHGVIVGIKGLYAGANIPITDGAPVRMG
jgi:hypothetical protein